MLPFTPAQFLDIFARYNGAVYPFQIVLVILAIAACMLVVKRYDWSGRAVSGLLSFFWLWMGIVYHAIFFAAINPFAYLFGALFVVEAALIVYCGILRRSIGFAPSRDIFSAAGWVCILYSLVLYPLIGTLSGHPYPFLPTFGLPCPTTIFTFGILLHADRAVPWYLVVIPFVWSCIGFFAALSLGITEDYGLIVAGILGTVLILLKNRRYSCV